MKVLLINPPMHLNKYKPHRACFPVGLAYVASVAREAGHSVEVLDCVVEGNDTTYPIGIANGGEKTNTVVVGLGLDEIRERIRRAAPDVVGITCLFYTMQQPTKDVARMAKEAGARRVVIGGTHASGLPEYMLQEAAIDYVVLGEGEYSFTRLLDALERGDEAAVAGMDGLARREGGETRVRPKTDYIADIDSVPFPAYDLFPLEKYFGVNMPSGLTSFNGRAIECVTSRGCPFNCTFCASTVYNGPYRPRSPENMVAELRLLRDRFGVREVQFVDDQVTFDRDRLLRLCRQMKAENLGLKWGTPNAVGPYTLDEEVVRTAAESGWYFTHLATESGDEQVLSDIMKKPTRVEQSPVACDLLNKYGVDNSLVFLVGSPGETFADIARTFRYAGRLHAREAFFYFATPLPGTFLYTLCRQKRYIPEDFLERVYDFQEPIITTPDWTPEELKRFVRKRVVLLHLRWLARNPLGFVWRYWKRYRRNLQVFGALWRFATQD